MTESFFHLTPHNDPDGPFICNDCAAEMAAERDAESPEAMGSTSFCVQNGCDAYTDEEHDTVIDQAGELSDVFYDALNAYSETHSEMSFDVILHALDCMAFCIKAQMRESAADA